MKDPGFGPGHSQTKQKGGPYDPNRTTCAETKRIHDTIYPINVVTCDSTADSKPVKL